MTPTGKKVVAVLLLVLLALPTGLCSLVFTPMGFASMSRGSFEHDIGVFMLLCSAVGWTICGLTIWGATRLTRSARSDPAAPSAGPSP